MRHPFRPLRTLLSAPARRRTPWTPVATELSGLPSTTRPNTTRSPPGGSEHATWMHSSERSTASPRTSAAATSGATGDQHARSQRSTTTRSNAPTHAAAPSTPDEDLEMPPACPLCHAKAGFLIDIEGTAYRVLEDAQDTQLLTDLTPEDLEEIGRAECNACGKKVDAVGVLGPAVAALRAPRRVTIGTGTTKNRLHLAGKAALRQSVRGRSLPACPECGATHDFVLDLDGFAYMVLEDDDDTELLDQSGAGNLLCSRCSAVFEL